MCPRKIRVAQSSGGWIWLRGYARLGPHGEIMGALLDVTLEMRNARALEESLRVRSLLSQAARVGLWWFDPRTQRLTWSEEWGKMLADAGVVAKPMSPTALLAEIAQVASVSA